MFSHRRVVRIEWGDCDAAGIVFYPRYFAIFDACTHRMLEAAGFPHAELGPRFGAVGVPMVDTRAKFLIASSYGDDVEIETRVADLGRSSFKIEHRAFKGGALAIEAFEARVWAGPHPDEPRRLKGLPIPEEVRRRLSEPAYG